MNILRLALSFVLVSTVAFLGSYFTYPSISGWYASLDKPFFNPPNFIFGPVWTTLYILMAVSFYLVLSSAKKNKTSGILIFILQLFLNLLWSYVFFGLQKLAFSVVVIALLWVSIFYTMVLFRKISKNAFYLLIPYILWVSFASILNVSIFILNQTPSPDVKINVGDKKDSGKFSRVSVIASDLNVPWGIAFLPDGEMLVTERSGTVRLINKQRVLEPEPVLNVSAVKEVGEGGLLGITLHPEFSSNKYVYLYYTYDEANGNTKNRVSRFTLENNKLISEKIIVNDIPGASNHNGGRIKFGPDRFLYITTGDAQDPSLAQDKNSLAGKILRVTDEGEKTPGNPFNNRVYSYGHRNPQGITWAGDTMYQTEHGPSGGQFGTGQDEFNYIQSGKNYGWPIIIGDNSRLGMETPFMQSGSDTWAPGDIAYVKLSDGTSSVFFGGLRGQALYEVNFIGDNRTLKTHFKEKLGRIREVVVGPENMLYITTSNTDGRGIPRDNDDKIIRIDPNALTDES